MFAKIAIENKSKHTDELFTYKLGENVASVGDRVEVPFGIGNKPLVGYVCELTDTCDYDEKRLKSITQKSEFGSLNHEMITTALWMKTRYAITYIDAINCFVQQGKPSNRAPKEPYKDIVSDYVKAEKLTEEQQDAVSRITRGIDSNRDEIFLLHGVTSSGKTEVYMSAIEHALESGKTAIMLVPEISLTPQLVERFAGRFGKEKIAVLHSKLTKKERFDEWTRLRNGEAKIAVGARMAVFAPLDNLGVIIMDEEHEATYKADQSPKYETVDVAAKRMKYYKGALVLGSATPSVVSFERAKEGIYELIELKHRYNKTPLPKIEVVDMRAELKAGNTTSLSRKLHEEIGLALQNKKQVILLQNRRGYSNFVSCRDCGNALKCPTCGISLAYHKTTNTMDCHYCGKRYKYSLSKCPNCGGNHMKQFGIGTELVEEEIQKYFPDATCERLDLDSTAKKGELDKILKRFKNKKTDILVGTQLVAKGLDFDNVGVSGVILADATLNLPDYRATERTYQLVTQVAGRSGRGSEQGKVIVQTYEPDNFVFLACKAHDYDAFFDRESVLRKYMEYPPFGEIMLANFTAQGEELPQKVAERFERYMKTALGAEDQRVFAPKKSPNFVGEEGSVRYYVLVKCPRGERNKYVYYLDEFSKKLIAEKIDCNMSIDINPYSMF